jgi:hypothetical protein
MLWESLVGIVVFVGLVLLLGPEWWSSSRGVLKEKERKEQQARKQEEARKQQEAPSQSQK